ncbi:hypothetical protein SeMB42_g03809 [Synchytrium endobioticum]|nr:hypothetical protein SeMB42_g03809 [Synchytrium endobioticum]
MNRVQSVLSPLVLVAASETSHASACQSNYESWAHLLSPFGVIHGKLQVRDIQGQPIVLEDYIVRFMTLSELAEYDPATVHYIANKSLQLYTQPNVHMPLIPSLKNVQQEYSSVNTDDLTPWYAQYRGAICDLIGVSEHDTFNHPIASLIITSANDADPVEKANHLLAAITKKASSFRGALDTNILRQYILIHDAHTANDQQVDQAIMAMKKAFGNAVQLVTINSIPKDATVPRAWSGVNYYIEKWREFAMERDRVTRSAAEYQGSLPDSNSGHERKENPLGTVLARVDDRDRTSNASRSRISASAECGQYFSEEDIKGLQTLLKAFVSMNLVPFMERNMQVWNEQVASARRGLTNRFMTASKRFFGSKQSGAEASPHDPTLVLYPSASPELVMRRLADYAFMLHDYKFAQSTYDSVKRDFAANDKAQKYLAGTQEMIGICALMTDANTPARAIEGYVDAATSAYKDANLLLYSIRTTLLFYELLKDRGLYRDCPSLLARANPIEESDVRGGIFLEQSGLAYLKLLPPMIRKYSFQTMLAGHWYARCGLKDHAYRCYALLDSIEDRRGWSALIEHHYFSLGRMAHLLGNSERGIELFVKLLKPHWGQSSGQQYTYVKELVSMYTDLVNKSGLPASMPAIEIPHIDMGAVYITLLEARQQKQDSDDDIWRNMENEFQDFLSSTNKRASRVPMTTMKNTDKTLCAIGEPLFVHFELSNPLQIAVALSDIVIECKLDVDLNAASSVSSPPLDARLAGSTLIEHEYYILEMLDKIVLDGLEKRPVRIRLHPKREGDLTILGLRYNLFESIPMYRPFDKRGRRLNDSLLQRTSQIYAPDNSLKLAVTAPMPLVDVVFHSFPPELLLGEVVKVIMEVTNKGNRGLIDLKVKMSHPSFMYIGNNDQMELSAYPSCTDEIGWITVPNALLNPSAVSVQLPTTNAATGENVLGPNSTTLIPIWLRGEHVGRHTFRFLFSYRSEDSNDKIGVRTSRLSMTADVIPSLRLDAFTRPSPRSLNDFVVGVEIENMHPQYDLELCQMTCSGRLWQLVGVDEAVKSSSVLSHNATIFCFFRIERVDTGSYKFQQSPEYMSLSAIINLITTENAKAIDPGNMSLKLSSIPLNSSQSSIASTSTPLQGLTANARMHYRVSALSAQYPMLTKDKLKDLFTSYVSDEVDLILFWRLQDPTSQKLRQGHLYLFGVSLSTQNSMPFDVLLSKEANSMGFTSKALFAQTVRERRAFVNSLLKAKQKEVCPIRVGVHSEADFKHDFKNGSFCVIPVDVVVRNSSWMNRAHFVLELISGMSSDAASPEYQWVSGPYCEGTLEPECEMTFRPHLCVMREGVYDISNWVLNVRTALAMDGLTEGQHLVERAFTQTSSSLAQYVTVHAIA